MSDSHCWPVRVYWEDTDASGVVYHANYLRWFERGRTEWLRALGFDQDKLMREVGVAFTVASLDIQYKRPARLDDELEVVTRIAELKKASLTFAQTLSRRDDRATVLCQARVQVACVDARTFAPRRMPELGFAP